MRILWCLLAVGVLAPAISHGEAGMPLELCRSGSCPCNGLTCGCGQVCTGNGCEASTASYCTNDTDCAATCGEFACESGRCASGHREPDGGFTPGDGGQAGPMFPPPNPTAPEGCGCTTTSAGLALVACAAVAALRRRRVA